LIVIARDTESCRGPKRSMRGLAVVARGAGRRCGLAAPGTPRASALNGHNSESFASLRGSDGVNGSNGQSDSRHTPRRVRPTAASVPAPFLTVIARDTESCHRPNRHREGNGVLSRTEAISADLAVVARGAGHRCGSPRRGRLPRRHCDPDTPESCGSLLASDGVNGSDGQSDWDCPEKVDTWV